MSHKGPYTVTFVSRRTGRESAITRKTFAGAENAAATYFLVENLQSRKITNAQGVVHSRYNFERNYPGNRLIQN